MYVILQFGLMSNENFIAIEKVPGAQVKSQDQ